MCVPSCKNLFPPAFSYIDTGNGNKLTCVPNCTKEGIKSVSTVADYVGYIDDKSDPNNWKCVSSAPTDYYLDELTFKN